MDTTSLYDNNYNGDAAHGGISGFWLKIIAVITMFIDHLGASIVWKLLVNGWVPAESYDSVYILYLAMRCIGRIAFPIYIFLLVEGFTYTRSRIKYAARLFAFAIISEVPFDLAFNDCIFEIHDNNVFWTLGLGLIAIMILDLINRLPKLLDASKSPVAWFGVHLIRCVGMAGVIIGMMALAEFVFCTDYGAAGIAAIVAMYLLRNFRKIGFAISVLLLTLLASYLELIALIAILPLHFYNGTRGKNIKYFFYAFYPVHLLILGVAGVLLFGMG